MNLKIYLLLLIPFLGRTQYKTDFLQIARSGIAHDFIGDTILFVSGAESNFVEYYDVNNGIIGKQEFTGDGFTGAKVVSNNNLALFYNLYGVNLSIRDLYIYDKVKKKWSDAYNTGVGGDFVEIKNNIVYSYQYKDSIDLYNLTSKVRSKKAYPVRFNDFSVCRSDDKVFFVGGMVNFNFSNKIHIYDLKLDSWSEATLESARASASTLFHDNKVFIVGGFNNNSQKLEIFDVVTKTSQIVYLPYTYWNAKLLAQGDKLLIGAGDQHNIVVVDLKTLNVGQPYILEGTASFSGLRSLKGAILGKRAIFAGDRFPRIYIYDFEKSNWEILTLPNVIENAAVFTYRNRLYVVGGYDEAQNKKYSNQILIFENISSTEDDISNETENVRIFPNPTNDVIRWETNDIKLTEFKLIDQQGKVVIQGSENEINLNHCNSGIYTLFLLSKSGETYVKRIVRN